MFKDRVFRTMILSALGLALFGLIKPASPDPRENVTAAQTGFFINKSHQPARYTGVIVGDSRALRGLAPSVMEQTLTGDRIFNAAFNAGGLNDEIFDYCESLLDPEAERPMIILVPTSLAFMPHKRANSQFHEYRDKPRDQVWLYGNFPGFTRWMQPLSPSVYVRKIFDLRPHLLLFEEFHDAGWIETDQKPHDVEYQYQLAEESISRYPIAPTLIQGVMDRTRRWTGQGIQVFGFFPPADPVRRALEDSVLGFDEGAFARDFQAAGGIWLDPGQARWETYDGSHLTGPMARELSRRIALSMAPHR